MQKKIKYLKNEEIDRQKWDVCIQTSEFSIVYAYSWYLDLIAPEWDALILDDYRAVMPLLHRKKYGICYIFIPPFTQQLGVFGSYSDVSIDEFLNKIPSKFSFIEQNLNEHNLSEKFVRKENKNYLLKLDCSYEEIKRKYNRNCKRNLNKAELAGYSFTNEISPAKFTDFIKKNLDEKLSDANKKVYILLGHLIQKSILLGIGEIIGLVDKDNILHATGFFYKDRDRIIFSVCASSESGKKNQAMYKLVDSQIKKFAGTRKWFDFEGSNIKGIAYFNSTFGAFPVKYQTVVVNRLPWWLKVLKK